MSATSSARSVATATDFLFTPFGHLADGNPYDAYVPSYPTLLDDHRPPDLCASSTCLDAAARRVNGQAVSASFSDA